MRHQIFNLTTEILLVAILELSQCPDLLDGLPQAFFLFKEYMWLYVKCGQSPEVWSWQSRMILSECFNFLNETLFTFISITPRTVYLCTCYFKSFDRWNQHYISGAQPSTPVLGKILPNVFQYKYSIEIMHPIIVQLPYSVQQAKCAQCSHYTPLKDNPYWESSCYCTTIRTPLFSQRTLLWG